MKAGRTSIAGISLYILVGIFLFPARGQAQAERILFYASFDKGVTADKAEGNRAGVFNASPAKLDWTRAAQSGAWRG